MSDNLRIGLALSLAYTAGMISGMHEACFLGGFVLFVASLFVAPTYESNARHPKIM